MSNIPKDNGLPIAHLYALLDPRDLFEHILQLIDSIHEALQRNLLQASDARVAEEGQGDARGSGLNAALINPPETFWRRAPRPRVLLAVPPPHRPGPLWHAREGAQPYLQPFRN